MQVLALNSGSSSLKAALVDAARGRRLFEVRVQNLRTPECELLSGNERMLLGESLSFPQAVELLLAECLRRSGGTGAIGAVAHRVVHGGAEFTQPVLVDDSVAARLGGAVGLAPLHNPPALAVVAAARRALPGLPHVAVFDTAFHATLPRRARVYALPAELSRRLGIRRYGFHGISHEQVSLAVARHLRVTPQSLRVISCHLGNGASIAAIEYGSSVETSMGMTPLEGLVMGSRAGDLDPGVLLHLLAAGDFNPESLERLLNGESGLRGLTGTEDMRAIERRAAAGDDACRLAIAVYAHRARKYVGAYAATMGGVDVIAFTGGVGEHSALIRHRIAQRLTFLGAVLDEDRNRDARCTPEQPLVDIATARSRVRILVLRADEETALGTIAGKFLKVAATAQVPARIPVALSARHAHLSRATLDALFGAGHELTPAKHLSQPGQFAAVETVTLVGPAGSIGHVRVLGPPRESDQVEISRTDEFVLGIDAPVRISGDTANSPGIVIEGPRSRITLASGVICARRHIHMHDDDAARLGLKDHDTVAVRVDSDGRDLVFGDVVVRVSPAYRLEMHVDLDEANAAGLKPGDSVQLLLTPRRHTTAGRP